MENNNKKLEKEERKKKLLEILNNDTLHLNIVDDIIFLEEELEKLRYTPKIIRKKKNHAITQITPAGRLYKEYLQQYINALKMLSRIIGDDAEEEESPLRKWVRERNNIEF